MNEQVFRIVALIITLAGAGVSIYFRQRAERLSGGERISLRHEGRVLMLSLRIVGLALWLSVVLYLLNPAIMSWSQLAIPSPLRWLGAGLGLTSDVLVYWVFSSLGRNVTPTVVTRNEHQLVTSGPYRYVRHPLYTVGFLSYISFALLSANWLVALLAIFTFLIIAARVPSEEKALLERNGDAYREYANRTGRFLPRVGWVTDRK